MNESVARYLCRRDAGDYLKGKYGVGTAKTLAKLATVGNGPQFRKLGARVVYSTADLDDWAESRLSKPVMSTSDIPTPTTSPARRGRGRPPKAVRAGAGR